MKRLAILSLLAIAGFGAGMLAKWLPRYTVLPAAEVQMTREGFVPAALSVAVGQPVIFRTVDAEAHWPASDPHPLHDDYREFDPGTAILPQFTWRFVPEQTGTWRYHDHRFPHQKGILTVRRAANPFISGLQATREFLRDAVETFRVSRSGATRFGLRPKAAYEDATSYVSEEMKICAGYGNRSPCYKAVTELFLRYYDTATILSLFKAIERRPEIYSRCHEVGHYLGRYEFRKHQDIGLAYAQCSTMVCGVGCQHGAAEEFFRAKQLSPSDSDEVIGTLIASACGDERSYARQILYHECLHGLGHGIMTFTDMDLPRTVRLCDALPSDWTREGCYAGAFMENSTSATSTDHPSQYVKDDDPTYPCSILDEKYQKLCYQYQSSYFGEKTGWNWPETARLCRQIPKAYQAGCLNQVATNQAMATQNARETKATCDLLPNAQEKDRCVEEVVSTFGGRYIDEPEFMLAFCEVVDAGNRKTCYRQMGATITYWGKSRQDREAFCRKLATAQTSAWCLLDEPGTTFIEAR